MAKSASYVIGLDYGTSSVRALVVRCEDGMEVASNVWPYPHGDEGVITDPSKLKQVLYNYLSNALKFTPDGGRVIVRSRLVSDSIVLMIADTGIGIAPQSLARLGRPFEQVESQLTKTYHGSGLGLAIARSLTNLHGGSMRLRSKLGTGTVVCVSLPRDGGKAKAKISAAA